MCKLQPNYAYTVNSVCCRFLSNQCVHYATHTNAGLLASLLECRVRRYSSSTQKQVVVWLCETSRDRDAVL